MITIQVRRSTVAALVAATGALVLAAVILSAIMYVWPE